jgi:glycerol uptake facilitator-like aquaporin
LKSLLRRQYDRRGPAGLPPQADLPRRVAAEALGSALLLAIVIGSGIMGERLAGGNIAVALLGNTIATGAGLVVLILVFGPVRGRIGVPAAMLYLLAQAGGAILGAIVAHAMFEEPLLSASTHMRSGPSQWLGEFVATFGLILTIFGCLRSRPEATPFAVGLFIVAGYWFTSSTSFANPTVTIARAMTDTFAGIRPLDAPAFILAQLAGAGAATLLSSWLLDFGRQPPD